MGYLTMLLCGAVSYGLGLAAPSALSTAPVPVAPHCTMGCGADWVIEIQIKNAQGQWVAGAEDGSVQFTPDGGPAESPGKCKCDGNVCMVDAAAPRCYAGGEFTVVYPGVQDYRSGTTGFPPSGSWGVYAAGTKLSHEVTTCGVTIEKFYEFRNSSDVSILRIHVKAACFPCNGTCP